MRSDLLLVIVSAVASGRRLRARTYGRRDRRSRPSLGRQRPTPRPTIESRPRTRCVLSDASKPRSSFRPARNRRCGKPSSWPVSRMRKAGSVRSARPSSPAIFFWKRRRSTQTPWTAPSTRRSAACTEKSRAGRSGSATAKKARQYLDKAIAIDPSSIDSNYFYADFLVDEGDYASAARYLKRALDAPPRPGRDDADAGRRAEAQTMLSMLREARPGTGRECAGCGLMTMRRAAIGVGFGVYATQRESSIVVGLLPRGMTIGISKHF